MKEDQTFPNNVIKIGQNAEDNDKIVKEAKQSDVWFHLSNLPSCHVIIEVDKKHPINKQMINHCAQLCKENTKYKNQSVKVQYTEIKNIKRTETHGKVIVKGKSKYVNL